MNFENLHFGKSGFLKLAVHIAGNDKSPRRHALGNVFEYSKAGMRIDFSVQCKTMAVEAPSLPRAFLEGAGIGNRGKINSGIRQRRIGFPESFVATEIGQA